MYHNTSRISMVRRYGLRFGAQANQYIVLDFPLKLTKVIRKYRASLVPAIATLRLSTLLYWETFFFLLASRW